MSFRNASLNLESFQECVLSEVSSSPVADVSNLVSRFSPAFAHCRISQSKRLNSRDLGYLFSHPFNRRSMSVAF